MIFLSSFSLRAQITILFIRLQRFRIAELSLGQIFWDTFLTMYGPGNQSGGAQGGGYSAVISVAQTESTYGSSLSGGKPNKPRDGPKERRGTPRGQMSASSDSKPSLAALDNALKQHFKEPAPLAKMTSLLQKKKGVYYSGIAGLLGEFEKCQPPAPTFPIDIIDEKNKRRREKILKNDKVVLERAKEYVLPDPNVATKEAYNTLFLSKLRDDMTSRDLQSFMEGYGEVVHVRVVTNLEGKSKHYGFVEFKREEDMKAAYHQVKRDGLGESRETVVVDVERGRTTQNWRPMKLGGGLGGRVLRKSRKDARYDKFEKLLLEKKNAAAGVSAYGSGRGAADRGGSGAGWSSRGRGQDDRGSKGGDYRDRRDRDVAGGGWRQDGRDDSRSYRGGGGGGGGGADGYNRGRDRGGYGARGGGGGGHRDGRGGGDRYRGGGGHGDRGGDSRGFAGKSAGIYGAGGTRGGDNYDPGRRERSRSRDRTERGYYGGR